MNIQSINIDNCYIAHVIGHYVGNKSLDEGCIFSHKPMSITPLLEGSLKKYFNSSFRFDNIHNFFHESELFLNEIYTYASKIFDNPMDFNSTSIPIAKHLYERSDHPMIKGGELYVVYFGGCLVYGQECSAIGLFKSESKEDFLTVKKAGNQIELHSQLGINTNKLDKGCIVFNSHRDSGYIVAVVDNTNKNISARYWIDDFLHIRQFNDEHFHTSQALSMTKQFVAHELPKHFDIQRADQIDILNRSMAFFKDNDHFNMEDFANEVIGQPEVIESFNQYRVAYEAEHELQIADEFVISDSAVKKQARSFKSVIKLDKNFHIYIHGDRKLIEQGEDEKGKYYKVYFKEEL